MSGGRSTFNQNDGGVVLHNLTMNQLQSMMSLNFTSNLQSNGKYTGTAYYLPQSFINNTLAAFNISGTLDPNAAYIGPCNTAGQLCDRLFLYGPMVHQVGHQPREAHADQGASEPRIPRAGAERLQPPEHHDPERRQWQRHHSPPHRDFVVLRSNDFLVRGS